VRTCSRFDAIIIYSFGTKQHLWNLNGAVECQWLIYTLPRFDVGPSTNFENWGLEYCSTPEKRAVKIGWIINNSPAHCQFVLKFGRNTHYGSLEASKLWKPLPVWFKMADGVKIRHIQIAITPPQIVQFRSNFVQSLIIWQPIHYRRSRSKNQRSRSQRDVTYRQ